MDKEKYGAIFEISEKIQPRLIISITFESGLNILMNLSYHKDTGNYCMVFRHRFGNGEKTVSKPAYHKIPDEESFERHRRVLVMEIAKYAAEAGGSVICLEFGPNDTLEEIINVIKKSDAFDITFFPK